MFAPPDMTTIHLYVTSMSIEILKTSKVFFNGNDIHQPQYMLISALYTPFIKCPNIHALLSGI